MTRASALAWLRDGAELLTATVSAAGEAPAWARGARRPAGFRAGRMAHETAGWQAPASEPGRAGGYPSRDGSPCSALALPRPQ